MQVQPYGTGGAVTVKSIVNVMLSRPKRPPQHALRVGNAPVLLELARRQDLSRDWARRIGGPVNDKCQRTLSARLLQKCAIGRAGGT
jgi:hypothetical protein